jgi:hypothetical protein
MLERDCRDATTARSVSFVRKIAKSLNPDSLDLVHGDLIAAPVMQTRGFRIVPKPSRLFQPRLLKRTEECFALLC